MTSFEISVTINQPIDIVVKALMNPENHTHWTKHLQKFEVIKSTPGKVGSIAHLHYLENGQSYIMKDELVYCDPGKKYISKVSGDALTAKVETVLESLGNNTRMKLKWSGKGKILFLKLFLPLMKKKMIKGAEQDLQTFKKLVEEKGASFK